MRHGTRKAIRLIAAFFCLLLFIRYLLPLVFPFLLGTALALGAEPLTSFFQKRLHLPRGVSTGISVTIAFCLLALAVLPASVQYPFVTGGTMIVSTLMGLLVGQRPTKREILSIALSFVGIMILIFVK